MSGTQPRRELLFENVFVGESFGPIEFIADEHLAKAYAFAIDDYNPWYFEERTPFGGRIFPSAAVVDHLVGIYHERYDYNNIASLHQKEEVWFHRPIPLGTRLILSGGYVDKFEKRGKGYATLEARAQDAHGNLYVRQKSTEIIRVPKEPGLGGGKAEAMGRRVAGVWPSDRTPVASAREALSVGTPVRPLRKRVYQDQMTVYSGRGEFKRNIHTDEAFAQSYGLPRTLAQGMMEDCYLSEYMASFFGAKWLEARWSLVTFLRPVFAGDFLTCRAVISNLTEAPEARSCEVEMWIEKDDGQMTAAGWARCALP